MQNGRPLDLSAQVKRVKRQPVSIMPEGLPAAMTKDEFRDLLAFLQGLR